MVKSEICRLFWSGLTIDMIARKIYNEFIKRGEKITRSEARAIVERAIADEIKRLPS